MTEKLEKQNKQWLDFFNDFEIVVEDIQIDATQDGGGVNIVGGGNIEYGPEGQNQDKEADNDAEIGKPQD